MCTHTHTHTLLPRYLQAMVQCDAQGLNETFWDNCVYDIAATGDDKAFLDASSDVQTETRDAEKETEEENEVYAREYYCTGTIVTLLI